MSPLRIILPLILLLAAPQARAEIALHKALYDLKTAAVGQGAGIIGVRGTMYYEQADACEAWTTDQRFTTEYQYPERPPVNGTNHYVAWEAKDGSRLEFSSERQEDGKPVELLRGSALRAEARAQYTRPDDLSYALPQGFFFPSAHMEEVIRQARLGKTHFTVPLFDGTDGNGPVLASAVIEKKLDPKDAVRVTGRGIDPTLLKPEAWRVRLAVFPIKDEEALLPAYEMEFVLHGNGVISEAVIDYRTFKVKQTLRTLEAVAKPECGGKK
jgi:EipB-like